jgi:hypothetical protein
MFMLWNDEDSIPASRELFKTRADARAYARSFRRRFAQQGYYLTTDWRRVAPKDIQLTILTAEP